MRITDRGRTKRELAIEDLDLLINDFARRTDHRDFPAVEIHIAHGDGDQVAVVLNHRPYVSAGRLDRERRILHEPLIPEKARENAQAVTGFFGFRSIWIEDAQAKLTLEGAE